MRSRREPDEGRYTNLIIELLCDKGLVGAVLEDVAYIDFICYSEGELSVPDGEDL